MALAAALDAVLGAILVEVQRADHVGHEGHGAGRLALGAVEVELAGLGQGLLIRPAIGLSAGAAAVFAFVAGNAFGGLVTTAALEDAFVTGPDVHDD